MKTSLHKNLFFSLSISMVKMMMMMIMLIVVVALVVVVDISSNNNVEAASLFPMYKIPVMNAKGRLALANDGSEGIFYFSPSIDPSGPNGNDFVLSLQGGWSCASNASCQARWEGAPQLMSSLPWAATKSPNSYNSQNPLENPFYSANMVYVPYISSDFWVGNSSVSEAGLGKWQFRGHNILNAVFEDIFRGFKNPGDGKVYRVKSGARLVFAGESAGGIGTLLNNNMIGDKIKKMLDPTVEFFALPDSGFFVGITDDLEKPCSITNQKDPMKCSYRREVMADNLVWNPVLDPVCLAYVKSKNKSDYECFFGEIALDPLSGIQRHNIFLAQYLFDEAALTADGVYDLLNVTDLSFLAKLTLIRKTILSAYPSFSPSCVGHILALKRIFIDDFVDEATAVKAWFFNGVKKAYFDKCFTPECRKGCHVKSSSSSSSSSAAAIGGGRKNKF